MILTHVAILDSLFSILKPIGFINFNFIQQVFFSSNIKVEGYRAQKKTKLQAIFILTST